MPSSKACPPPGHPNPGIKPGSSTLQVDSLMSETQGKPMNTEVGSLSLLQWIFPTQESNQGFLHVCVCVCMYLYICVCVCVIYIFHTHTHIYGIKYKSILVAVS